MSSVHLILDEDLVRRLPLPLAQLYRRTHNAKTPLERHLTAYYLWEAALKLLGSVAVIEYAETGSHDPRVAERLTNLARPALGHWWEFVRLLLPLLADQGDTAFQSLRDLVLGRTRDDLPRLAGLDGLLREALEGSGTARSTVRLSELFDRLVRYRNQEMGHGAAGQRSSDFYDRMGWALLAGTAELFGRVDVLAGRQLVYAAEVRGQASGHWLVERYELIGETPRRLEPLQLPASASARLPRPEWVYLSSPPGQGNQEPSSVRSRVRHPSEPQGQGNQAAEPRMIPLHPLVVYDIESAEMLFLNARRGRQRTEYLCYSTGRVADRDVLAGEQRALLAQVLNNSVAGEQVEQWTARSLAEEPAGKEPAGPPSRCLGEFELLSELGRGGMGVVYRAWQPSLGRQVALKCLLRAGDPKAEARFAREIRALGHVEHPHLIKIFTSGSQGEQWFYAMELIEGASLTAVCDRLSTRRSSAAALNLNTWKEALTTACQESRQSEKRLNVAAPPETEASALTKEPALPPAVPTQGGYVEVVADLVRQVAEAAHALHEAGVIHRDIKPGNIMLSHDGRHAVLMDLGLAKLVDDGQGRLTRTRQFVGTLRYASPEQVLAVGAVDRRSDVYSLGVTLWELLTLRPLFGATDETPTPELMQRIQYEEPERVQLHNPRVSADLEAVVLKCLEKDPRRRYAGAADLAADLQRNLNREPVQARPIGKVRRALRQVRRRPALALGILACLLALLAAGAGFWYWDSHYRLKVEYFAKVAKRWGAFQGVSPVTLEQARHRFLTFRIYRRGRQVERVDFINGQQHLTSRASVATYMSDLGSSGGERRPRECTIEYRRNAEGQVIEETAYDRAGELLWIFHYTTNDMGTFTDRKGFPRSRAGSGAAYVQFVRASDGLETEVRYLDKDGRPQPGQDGTLGHSSKVDSRDLPVELSFLGPDDKPALNNHGYVRVTWVLDGQGNHLEEAYWDQDGKPTRDSNGCAKYTYTYDAHGNLTGAACFGLDGRPVMHKLGFSSWKGRCDDLGNQVEETYFDTEGRPMLQKEGYARWTAGYDENGNMIDEAYFDVAGRPVRCKDGYARETARIDERGNCTEASYFDEAGHPTPDSSGAARIKSTYDERSNRTEEAYFDENGRRVWVKEGYSRWTARYDDRDNCLEKSFLDVADKPVRIKEGYARWTARYDDGGNLIGQDYFDEAGQPVRSTEGYARWTCRYDERGHCIEEDYLDEAGKPVRNQDGCARRTSAFDERGNCIEGAYFDEAGKPARRPAGNVKFTARYDERGNRIEETLLDENGKPVRLKAGYARWTARYDGCDNLTEQAYFDENGQPVRSEDGYARKVARHNERGNCIEVSYFDEAGRPTPCSAGNVKFTARYDERDNRIEEAYFDENGKAVRLGDGYARFTARYDERGNRIEEDYFDEADRPVRVANGYARWSGRYDERGNQTEEAYFDEAARPVSSQEGYARWTAGYDDQNNRTDQAFFDVAGHPVPVKVVALEVFPDTQGRHLGITRGDVFLKYGGKDVRNVAQFISDRRGERTGDRPKELQLLRSGKIVTVPVMPGPLGVRLRSLVLPN